ncbi:MAG: FHA domain-containing protein [Planctomycetaceae bacterium]|nr:FHA domain-containing protein [Planctomycetaceae bacterium]
MSVKLKVLRGASSGKEVAIRGPRFFIGRSEECNLRANSDAISRKHCAITVEENGATIRDLGSRNGTFVNGSQIDGIHRIQMGDQLRVGPLEFLVTQVEEVRATQPEPTKAEAGDSTEDEMAGMVGDWLEEAESDDSSASLAAPETREYKLDDTDLNLDVVKPAEKDDPSAENPKDDSGSSDTGKLPRKPTKNVPKDTQEAAAQMLRKFFNRG